MSEFPLPEKKSINPWLLVLGVAFGFVVLAVGGALLAIKLTPEQGLGENERLMPDGSILRIEKLTWKQPHQFEYEISQSGSLAFWNRRRQHLHYGYGQEGLVVWMTRRDAHSGRPLDFDWWQSSLVVDAYGDEIPDSNPFFVQMSQRSSSGGSGNRPFKSDRLMHDTWVVASMMPVFRMQDGRFTLRVKNTSDEVVATFDLVHPAPPVLPTWQPEVLPAMKANGDLTVTLNALKRQFHWNTNNGVKQKWWYFTPENTVLENGQPSSEWITNLLDVSDPLGNHAQSYNQQVSFREPAWKVRMVAVRQPHLKFSPAETWTISGLALPEKDKAVPLTDIKTIDGVTLRLGVIAGAGTMSYEITTPSIHRYGNTTNSYGGQVFQTNTREETKVSGSTATFKIEASFPHLLLEASGMTAGLHRLYVKAQDDQGRQVPTQQRYMSLGELQSFFFNPEADAKSLDVTIVLHTGRMFEFLVKPPELPTDEKPMP